ncbi:MAG: chorismate synthase [Candidatus Lambdaproteobacteria bacterium RIFOXYD1_FULL_56_27]|uniref:Chorismate synthase n=1 Tax=Candidatus Lambdaproteobacteria bacterium RIFOXYD2_FULL_56_26 TaxID=1817773 RepID=A0A1F6H2P4_9PROT|nr:MAG: chorismate synthase [Candidatus Lambdaproteobacteria bacterium RIFOXYC1_FULL_56_13]OGH04632.1 MAG: chorismate synthase [Candidatus Lambdaproteobacteria bacterium RIFOXYD2_FULL_56_26]OGH09096.1 MAG: chorismate synthase [Candidatus Lambdaproteobacteria bacterium RIFOXYD1_FULL_56_27]
MNNSFGHSFVITTFGESHGVGLGVVVDGCPAGLELCEADIQRELDRRKPGQSRITTSRKEEDRVQVLSGIYQGRTLGTPIGMVIYNGDAKSDHYDDLKDLYRPGHADFTYDARFGFRDHRGGGRASNREAVGRVAGGAVAKALLETLLGTACLSWVEQVHQTKILVDPQTVTLEAIEANEVRCPDPKAASLMIEAILAAKAKGNSLGGKIGFVVKGLPAGLGAPVFDKLTADLAKALMSIPATRSVSFGLGEEATLLTGLEHNDLFVSKGNRIGTVTNRAGGVLGGMSNGEPLWGHVTFKPTATLLVDQDSVNRSGEALTFKAKGRHDPCVLPRAVPNVDAMVNLVLADHLLRFVSADLSRLKKALS